VGGRCTLTCIEICNPARGIAPTHQTLKNRLLLENYYLPREHGYLTLADVYFGRGQTILIERERTKRQTFANRRVMGRQQAA
jgi:putative transposase